MTSEMVSANGVGSLAPAPPSLDSRRALMPQSYAEAFSMAERFARSGMFAVKSADQALVVLMTGMELGLPPAAALRGIHVIQGRPSPSADTLVAICLSHPDKCRYFRPINSDEKSATYETWRVGHDAPTTWTYTLDDAKKEDLLSKDMWRKFPKAMLRARCSTVLARMIYQDLTLGLYIPDEAEDMEPIMLAAPQQRAADTRPDQRQAAPRQAAPRPAPAAALLMPDTIQERRDYLRRIMQDMSDEGADVTLRQFTRRFGRNDYSSFDLDQCEQAIIALETGKWPKSERVPAAEDVQTLDAGSGEADPFDDANGFKSLQPALMEADVQGGKGHGES